MKRIIIVGATSGIGNYLAKRYIQKGDCLVGVAGRNEQSLAQLQQLGSQVYTQVIDINSEEAPQQLARLIEKVGGMDTYLHVSGIGFSNPQLDAEKELNTVETNTKGFTRMLLAAYQYFREHPSQGKGHIAAITSVAATRSLGPAPAYSATKKYQATYLSALAQLSHIEKLPLTFTDIRPGFVDTPLLKQGTYPMLMSTQYAGKRIFKAIERRKRVAVIDWRYRCLVAVMRLTPRFIWERLPLKKQS